MGLSKEGLKEMMKDHNVVVLDVLSAEEFEKKHITGSQSQPMTGTEAEFVEAVGKKFDKNYFFVTYCASVTCNAGPSAAKALNEMGYRAEDYPGGIKEWSEAGYPTEGTDVLVPNLGQAVKVSQSN